MERQVPILAPDSSVCRALDYRFRGSRFKSQTDQSLFLPTRYMCNTYLVNGNGEYPFFNLEFMCSNTLSHKGLFIKWGAWDSVLLEFWINMYNTPQFTICPFHFVLLHTFSHQFKHIYITTQQRKLIHVQTMRLLNWTVWTTPSERFL